MVLNYTRQQTEMNRIVFLDVLLQRRRPKALREPATKAI
jgi:hypothetical protein